MEKQKGLATDLRQVKKTATGVRLLFQCVGLVLMAMTGIAFAQEGLATVLPHTEAGTQIWDYIGLVIGSGIMISLLFALHQVAQGLAYGFLVRGWNVLAPNQTAIRFGTATGCYDSIVSKVGYFAVWGKFNDDHNDCLVIDRVPYGMIFNGRLTTTTAKNSNRQRKEVIDLSK